MGRKELAALKLRVLRVNAGLTKDALGQTVGVTGQTIARLESGELPSPPTAKAIADHFGTTVTDIWPELGQVPKPKPRRKPRVGTA
jgi:DNA-binding XRE family transcriptional regulator